MRKTYTIDELLKGERLKRRKQFYSSYGWTAFVCIVSYICGALAYRWFIAKGK